MPRTHLRLLWTLTIVSVCLAGCSHEPPGDSGLPQGLQNRWPLQYSVDDVTTDVPALNTPDWELVVEEGEGSTGYDRITISASGNAQYRFWDLRAEAFLGTEFRSSRDTWRQAGFTLPPEQLTKIRQEAFSPALWRLKKEYHAAVADGFQITVKAQAGGHVKHVYCDNYVPSALYPLLRTLRADIAERQAVIRTAVPTTRPTLSTL